MINNSYLDLLHSDILEIMNQIHSLCEKNNISYYLVGGTLLGAIRHKGFIPWDDDLDIAMPREDFNRFIKICEKQLPEYYKLIWITTNKKYWLPFAKIHDTRTVFKEQDYERINLNMGIFVDIFPLDDAKSYSKVLEFRKKLIGYICGIKINKLYKRKATYIYLLCKLIPSCILNWMLVTIMTIGNKRSNKYYINLGSQYSVSKQLIKRKYYGSGTKMAFNGMEYICPTDYSKVLESIYGKDYMKLPPIEKRKTHYPAYVKTRNGVEFNFAHIDNKIRIEE